MSIWDSYPADYRAAEVNAICAAVQSGECAAVIGLSGAGKSNLMGFLRHRVSMPSVTFALVDGNRAQPRTADGLFQLSASTIAGSSTFPALSPYAALETALANWMAGSNTALCLLFDRFDALPETERREASGPLRALRDAYKYQLTYVIATRRPLDPTDELAELFYANTLWLGPLSPENARWSAQQYAARRGQTWDEAIIESIIQRSWGYPSLLRAVSEAYANGAALDEESLRAHPAVQRRVDEFWADSPTPDDLRRSGLHGHPLLSQSQPVTAASPDLTASEHRLLAYLQAHPGQVCAKDDLIQAVWPEEKAVDGLRDDSLAQLIRRLRTKIEPDPSHPTRLLTVPGRGYRYID